MYIGLMSGTSLDGVDGVLLTEAPSPSLHAAGAHTGHWHSVAHVHRPLPAALRAELLALNTPGDDELHRSALAAQGLAQCYAEVALQVCDAAGVPPTAVRAIGAHGQTVRHRPELGYTCQLNAPALLAELTGIDVVADLRSRDLAAGGQGAPLVPAFHQAVFGRPEATVVAVNIGGMANLSVLRPGQAPRGFDSGPGNVLMDGWCERHTGQAFDADGAWGAAGQVLPEALALALAEPYFALPPPKSTGRDLFHMGWLDAWLARSGLPSTPAQGLSPELARDIQATLCALTAESLAQAVHNEAAQAQEVVVSGGGALNADLMQRLTRAVQARQAHTVVLRSEARGMAVMAVEAAAFAWLAWAHVTRQAGNVPEVTGARGGRVLGALYPA